MRRVDTAGGDANGDMYVADSGNDRVRLVMAKTVWAMANRGNASTDELSDDGASQLRENIERGRP